MSDDDNRQQQELEEARMQQSLEVLDRVGAGLTTKNDMLFLAAELGILTEYRRHQQERKAA